MKVRTFFPVVFMMTFLFSGMYASAQDNHFIYLQSDNGQPFYVRMDDKLFSSSSAGYLILSKLPSRDYRMKIGFPRDAFPEEEYLVSLNGQNEGFILRNTANKWALHNLGTGELITAVNTAESQQAIANADTGKVKDDLFSSMLANVVKDSSILRDNTLPDKDVKTVVAQKDEIPQTANADNTETAQTEKADSATVTTGTDVVHQAVTTVEKAEINTLAKDSATVAESFSDTGNNITADTTNLSAAENLQESLATNTGKAIEDFSTNKTETGKEVTPKQEDTVAAPIEIVVVQEPVQVKKNKNPFIRILSTSQAGGQEMIYVNKETNDTISLLIPAQAPVVEDLPEPETTVVKPSVDTAELTITPAVIIPQATVTQESAVKEPIVKEEKKDSIAPHAQIIYNDKSVTEEKADEIKEAENEVKKDAAKDEINEAEKPTTGQATIVYRELPADEDCNAVATEEDFFTLRKEMAQKGGDLEMINVARSYFAEKCFTTEQIQNLSYLFLSDNGKYHFFDVAYSHVSDRDQFSKLQKLLKDNYYIKRFKAMIR